MKDCRLVFTFNSIKFTFHCFFLSTLPALNDFLQNYDYGMIIMGDFSTTEKWPKNHFMLMSLIFLRITKMKQLTKFLKKARTSPWSVYMKVVGSSVLSSPKSTGKLITDSDSFIRRYRECFWFCLYFRRKNQSYHIFSSSLINRNRKWIARF